MQLQDIKPGDTFTFLNLRIEFLHAEKRARYIQGETETRAGRFQTEIRLSDAIVYYCKVNGQEVVNNESEMRGIVETFTKVQP